MILLISTCSQSLSEEEFVKPVKRIIGNCEIIHCTKVTRELLLKASKVVICGTALKDFEYLNIDWSWIKSFKKPLIGICAGYQVIARELGEELVNKELIGVKKGHYFLTSKLIIAKKVRELENIEGFTVSFKHENITAYAYHPEVLNEELITSFIKES